LPRSSIADSNPSLKGIKESDDEHAQKEDHGCFKSVPDKIIPV